MKFKWPLVWRKTYETLLDDYHRHEDHYWKQFSHNGMWERKAREAEAKLKELEKKHATEIR